MMNLDTNFIHPEIQKGEVFFMNTESAKFKVIDFESKRIGNIAYDGNGNLLDHEDWFPVFLKEDEMSNSGFSLMELRRKFR